MPDQLGRRLAHGKHQGRAKHISGCPPNVYLADRLFIGRVGQPHQGGFRFAVTKACHHGPRDNRMTPWYLPACELEFLAFSKASLSFGPLHVNCHHRCLCGRLFGDRL